MNHLSEALLVPHPLEASDQEGVFLAGTETAVVAANPESGRAAIAVSADLRELLAACGSRPSPGTRIELVAGRSAGASPEAYEITVTASLITVAAAEARGLFMGRATLRQLLIQGGGAVPCGRITDAPAFAHRGYMLDVSRNKVPTMETLLAFIELLSQFKYNHFQLYIEHTFAYKNHRTVWEDASPFTAEEIRFLDSFCRDRHIEFVPNQNSLGHVQQWLKHPDYTPLAECPEGFPSPWSPPDWSGPCTLCPGIPGSFDLVQGLYREFLPNFSSPLFNVGCDEPWELGLGRSREDCERRGKGRVYLDWLLRLHRLCGEHGRKMLFWADIINEHPELVPELPKDMIPLEWGYDAGHPWHEHCARFQEAGLQFFVCPGTSTWSSIAGRTDNAIANLREAAEAGHRHGALGFLVTEWGDGGHRQFLPVNYLPAVAAASCSWNPSGFEESSLARALDSFILQDPSGTMGQWFYDFGNLYRCDPSPAGNSSRFVTLLNPRDGIEAAGKLSAANLDTAIDQLEALEARLNSARMQCAEAGLIREEMALSIGFLKHACRRGLAVNAGHEKETAPGLAEELAALIGRFRELWLRRNRPGGLEDSARLLENLREYYAGLAAPSNH